MDTVFVHPTAIVDNGAIIGNGSKIWHFAHVRSDAQLGENVIVGKSSYIDTKVKIGNNVKIQNLVSIYYGVTIGNNVFVGPHVTFTNDLYPRVTGDWKIVKTIVENGVSIGANSTILCGIVLGENSLIAAGSVVIHDVPKHAVVAGNPARLKGYVCHCARKILPAEAEAGDYDLICPHCEKTNQFRIE